MDYLKDEINKIYNNLLQFCTELYVLKIIDEDEFLNLGIKIDVWYRSCFRR